MDIDQLKKYYLENKLPYHHPKIMDWVLKNIRSYVSHYPPKLSPTGVWDKEACETLLTDFIVGRSVIDRKTGEGKIVSYFNIVEVFDRADNLKIADSLLKNQIHFFFRKNKEKDINDNLVRRIKEIVVKNKNIRYWKLGGRLVLGLKVWEISDPGHWDSSDEELYHLSYSVIGDYERRIYKTYSEYSSPEISDKDLQKFLVDILAIVNKKLNLSQILYVLGYKLSINEIQLESLDEEREVGRNLYQSISADVSLPDEEFEYDEIYDLVCKRLDMANKEFLPLLDFLLQNPNSIDEYATKNNRAKSTVYHQTKQIGSILNEYAKTPYEQHMLLNKMREKRLPQFK